MEDEVSKKSSKNSSHETKRENNSFKDTRMTKNKESIGKKRKQLDHLEGEFRKINPSLLMVNKMKPIMVKKMKPIF
jgi:hypothetical protein